MDVSCIIPSYNSKHLNSLLESIFKNTVLPSEVLVVDDGSTHETDIRNFNIKKIKNNKNEGPSKARNLGFKKAEGEIILFLDSDIEVPADLIENIINFFKNNHSYQVWTTGYSSKIFSHNLINRYKSKYMNYIHKIVSEEVDFVLGACCAIRKEKFIAWNESLRYAEDTYWGHELVYRHKHRIFFDQKNLINHFKKYTLLSWIKNDFLIAKGMTHSLFIKKNNKQSTSFSHVSATQLCSVLLSGLILLLFLGGDLRLFTSMVIVWLLLSYSKVKYISTKGTINIIMVYFLYFLNCVIHLMGIFSGLCKNIFSFIIKK